MYSSDTLIPVRTTCLAENPNKFKEPATRSRLFEFIRVGVLPGLVILG